MKLYLIIFISSFLYFSHSASAQLKQEWSLEYVYQNQYQLITDITIDKNDNIFIVIESEDSIFLDKDAITLKISPTGELLWANAYTTDTSLSFLHSCETPVQVRTDENNNIYILGNEYMNTPADWYENLFLIKYSPTGEQQWKTIYEQGEKSTTVAYAMEIDDNRLIVTGTVSTLYYEDIVTWYFDKETGQLNKQKTCNNGSHVQIKSLLAVDHARNSYVGGGLTDFKTAQVIVLKYDDHGELLFKIMHHSPTLNRSSLRNMECTTTGELLVYSNDYHFTNTGSIANLGYTLLYYAPTGKQLWQKAALSRYAEKMLVDHNDDILLVFSDFVEANNKRYLQKYNSSGELLWSKTFERPTFSRLIVVDAYNYIYAQGGDGIVCYTPEETLVWNYSMESNIIISAIFFDKNNYLYYVGQHRDSSTIIGIVKLKTPLSLITALPTHSVEATKFQVSHLRLLTNNWYSRWRIRRYYRLQLLSSNYIPFKDN